ncbi:DUF2252 domain-containing protein [Streptomyces tateyamensis]|uniref:DUF2252 domain-containing protein n=1 Tax=Streptomyces tateyamensis TaxID=565073 RepID=A0A2V4NH17_9ACTN|nr:DUF2252 domain-containing protein [Streptomyces tateyamensis]PYC78562.1 DUF2252 domain-containing protein [Streptomyces tateyamensis]
MTTPAERVKQGRAARRRIGRRAQGQWVPAADRPDPVAVLLEQGADRVQELLPIRHGRMARTPFTFLRGAAAVLAADLAAGPDSGLIVQLCGDAHLLNFGVYASPERSLLFDLNDFDETHPGPFEWDVKRLAASVAVAARDNGDPDEKARAAAQAAAQAYRLHLHRLAGLGELDVWYEMLDTEDLLPLLKGKRQRRATKNLEHARRRNSLQAFAKLTEPRDGRPRIVADPPLVEPVELTDYQMVGKVFSQYRASLPDERKVLLDRFQLTDAARKVVGVGSVGTRCYILLLQGRDADDPLFLQLKEAQPSVLARHAAGPVPAHQGHRVVAGQRLLQAASDIFLGWTSGPAGRHFYGRQLRDMKGSAEVEQMTPGGLRQYAALCGTALARAHARSGDRIAISGYLGASDAFDQAIAEFAMRYADQTEADHAALVAAIEGGAVAAEDL